MNKQQQKPDYVWASFNHRELFDLIFLCDVTTNALGSFYYCELNYFAFEQQRNQIYSLPHPSFASPPISLHRNLNSWPI